MISVHRWLAISSFVLVTGAILVRGDDSSSSSFEEATPAELKRLEELIRNEIFTYFKLLMSDNDDELKSLLLLSSSADGGGDSYVTAGQGANFDQGRISSISFGHSSVPPNSAVSADGGPFRTQPGAAVNQGAHTQLMARDLPAVGGHLEPLMSDQWREGMSKTSEYGQNGPEGITFRFGGGGDGGGGGGDKYGGRYPPSEGNLRGDHGPPPHGPPPHGPPPPGPPRQMINGGGFEGSETGRKEFRGRGGLDSGGIMELNGGGGGFKPGKKQRGGGPPEFGGPIVEFGPPGRRNSGGSQLTNEYAMNGGPDMRQRRPLNGEFSTGKMQSQFSMRPDAGQMMEGYNFGGTSRPQFSMNGGPPRFGGPVMDSVGSGGGYQPPTMSSDFPGAGFSMSDGGMRRGKATDGEAHPGRMTPPFSMSDVSGATISRLPSEDFRPELMKSQRSMKNRPGGGGMMMETNTVSGGHRPPGLREFSMNGGPNGMMKEQAVGGFSMSGQPGAMNLSMGKPLGGEFAAGKMPSQFSMADRPPNSGVGYRPSRPLEFSVSSAPNSEKSANGGFHPQSVQLQFVNGGSEFGGVKRPPNGALSPSRTKSQVSIGGGPGYGGVTGQPNGDFLAGNVLPMRGRPGAEGQSGFPSPSMRRGELGQNEFAAEGGPAYGRDSGLPLNYKSQTRGLQERIPQSTFGEGMMMQSLENNQIAGGNPGKNRQYRVLILNGNELPESLKMSNGPTQMKMSSGGDGLVSTTTSTVDGVRDMPVAALPMSSPDQGGQQLAHHTNSGQPAHNSSAALPVEMASSVAGASTLSVDSTVENDGKMVEVKQGREANAQQKPKILRVIPVKMPPASQKN